MEYKCDQNSRLNNDNNRGNLGSTINPFHSGYWIKGLLNIQKKRCQTSFGLKDSNGRNRMQKTYQRIPNSFSVMKVSIFN